MKFTLLISILYRQAYGFLYQLSTSEVCDCLQITYSSDCNSSSNCKWTFKDGGQCINGIYDCSTFNGLKDECQSDSNYFPCVYQDGNCSQSQKCSDLNISPSLERCQKFSTNCIYGGGETCVDKRPCSEYDSYEKCKAFKIGLNDKICGWYFPQQKCKEFTKCSDDTETNIVFCQIWNESCTSDGTTCINFGECSSYLTEYACKYSLDLNNYSCFWTGNACRNKQCSDIDGSTELDCWEHFKEGVCTTNGTKCIIRGTCDSYLTKEACTTDQDGTGCWYGYLEGQSTGKQSCRKSDCTDLKFTTHSDCQSHSFFQPYKCVSNGTNCVNYGTCDSYKNEFSCQAGGTDSKICVFKYDTNSCVPFNSCSDANNDSQVCGNSLSCFYYHNGDANSQEKDDCIMATCQNKYKNYQIDYQCGSIQSFDKKSLTVCSAESGSCDNTDPSTLPIQYCFLHTGMTYTWNPKSLKCEKCKKHINNSNDSNGSNGNNTSTNSTIINNGTNATNSTTTTNNGTTDTSVTTGVNGTTSTTGTSNSSNDNFSIILKGISLFALKIIID